MNWLEIKKRISEYERQVDEGLINTEEFRRSIINFLVTNEVVIFTLHEGYETVCDNLRIAMEPK